MGRVGGALAGGLVLAVLTQAPVWDAAPVLAVVNGVVAVAFVLTGALLAEYPEQRANGVLMAATGVGWSGVWLDLWGSAPLSVVALFCPAVYVVTGATVLLRYPAARLPGRVDRAFVAALFGWLPVVHLGSVFIRAGHEARAAA